MMTLDLQALTVAYARAYGNITPEALAVALDISERMARMLIMRAARQRKLKWSHGTTFVPP